ncbi:MAG: prolyl oligopeptidase [Bradymonadia bacterium]|jgi:prolyl oligopeptidase
MKRALFATLLIVGCGGTTAAPTSNPMPETETPTVETPSISLDALNQAARAGAVTEDLHGVSVSDPYRGLEEDNAATDTWVDAQNAATEGYFTTNARDGRRERLQELLSIGFYAGVARAGGRTFIEKREGEIDHAILYVIDGPDAEPRELINPNTMDERTALDFFIPSPSGEYLAYGLSQNGDERSTTHVLDVATGENLTEAIPHTKWTALDWRHDEAGFYYTRYPSEGEADYDAEAEDTYNRHLFYHELGTDHANDPLIFRAPDPTDFVSGEVSEDGRYLLIGTFRGWSASDMRWLDLEAGGEPTPLVVGEDSVWWGGFHEGRLLIYTNADAPLGRVLSVANEDAGDRAAWQEIVPEGQSKLEAFYPIGDLLVIPYVENVSSRVRVFGLDGTEHEDLALPLEIGSVGSIASEPGSTVLTYQYTSYFFPPALFETDLVTRETHQIDAIEADVDTSAYEVTRATVESPDGTPINVFIAHRTDMVRDGNQPVLLNGYGGFNVSLTPGFARSTLYWLEQGGVFAVANIRGGGEFGEEWHQAGMLGEKANVFEDFEAVIRWLGGESGISNSDRIAITGGSNGGLLMGAMLTRCPDAFRATVTSVGLYDMVRYTLFPPAEIWVSEYGDPEVAEDFNWLHAYSPYHNVEAGTEFPATLMLTADSDSRVSWQHSTKFAAALQEANTGDHPILFLMKQDQGHGAGTSLSDTVDAYVQRYTFIETELGL